MADQLVLQLCLRSILLTSKAGAIEFPKLTAKLIFTEFESFPVCDLMNSKLPSDFDENIGRVS